MIAQNDITGDKLQSKVTTDNYRDNYDLIFNKKKKEKLVEPKHGEQLELNLHERNPS